jgi:hypothetical protein
MVAEFKGFLLKTNALALFLARPGDRALALSRCFRVEPLAGPR